MHACSHPNHMSEKHLHVLEPDLCPSQVLAQLLLCVDVNKSLALLLAFALLDWLAVAAFWKLQRWRQTSFQWRAAESGPVGAGPAPGYSLFQQLFPSFFCFLFTVFEFCSNGAKANFKSASPILGNCLREVWRYLKSFTALQQKT